MVTYLCATCHHLHPVLVFCTWYLSPFPLHQFLQYSAGNRTTNIQVKAQDTPMEKPIPLTHGTLCTKLDVYIYLIMPIFSMVTWLSPVALQPQLRLFEHPNFMLILQLCFSPSSSVWHYLQRCAWNYILDWAVTMPTFVSYPRFCAFISVHSLQWNSRHEYKQFVYSSHHYRPVNVPLQLHRQFQTPLTAQWSCQSSHRLIAYLPFVRRLHFCLLPYCDRILNHNCCFTPIYFCVHTRIPNLNYILNFHPMILFWRAVNHLVNKFISSRTRMMMILLLVCTVLLFWFLFFGIHNRLMVCEPIRILLQFSYRQSTIYTTSINLPNSWRYNSWSFWHTLHGQTHHFFPKESPLLQPTFYLSTLFSNTHSISVSSA